jgi:UDP-glucose 4-epimerase
MGTRVLVTGGAGFIGSHIVEKLVDRGHRVCVLDNLSTGFMHNIPPEASLHVADITGDVQAAFRDFQPEVVFHQAAQVSVSHSMADPEEDARTNILGSLRVIEACRDHDVQKLIYASSAAAYGTPACLPLRESHRPQPVSFYGASKYAVEHYLRTAGNAWGLQWTALRYANVYGPRQNVHGEAGVVAIFCDRLAREESPTIYGGGELTRDYVYVGDVAAANVAILDSDLSQCTDPVFNVSTGERTSTNTLFATLKTAFASSVEPIMGGEREGDVHDSCLDSDRLRALTGWRPTTSLKDGLAQTAASYRESVASA